MGKRDSSKNFWDINLVDVWRKTSVMFNRDNFRSNFLCALVWFTLSFGFYGLSEWLPTYFQHLQSVNEYTSALFTSIAQFPGSLLTCWMLEYWLNRKTTLALSIGLSAATIIGIPFIQNSTQIVILLCIFDGVSVGAWAALNVVSTELVPTSIRSTAYGVFSACGRIGAIAGNITFGLFGEENITGALSVCGVVLLIGTVCGLLLPNTKGVGIR